MRISTKGKFVHKDGNHLDCYTEEDALKQFIGLCDDTRIKGDEGLGLLVADGDSGNQFNLKFQLKTVLTSLVCSAATIDETA